jgi:hypothetical protein
VMTELFTLFLAITLLGTLIAQDRVSSSKGANELKINLTISIAEISYERVINNDIGLGITTAYSFNEFDNYGGMILPYFRFYPSQNHEA